MQGLPLPTTSFNHYLPTPGLGTTGFPYNSRANYKLLPALLFYY